MALHFIKYLHEDTDTREIVQNRLSFGKEELDPVMSKDTIDYHYSGLAAKYFERYNAGEGDSKFNYGGAMLHNLYFGNLIPPRAANKPTEAAGELINSVHDSFESFKKVCNRC